MERVRGGHPTEGHRPVAEPRLELLHLVDRPPHHASVRSVHNAEIEPADEEGPHRPLGQGHGCHSPPRTVLHEAGSLRNQGDCLIPVHDPTQARRHILPEAVADHRLGNNAPRHPEPGQRILDREERGLAEAGLVQLLRCLGRLSRGRVQKPP